MRRRTFLARTVASALATVATGRVWAGQAPGIVRASRPLLPQGVAAGDAGRGRMVVWSRSDRPARISVEYATTDKFVNSRTVQGPSALEASDFTARVVLTDIKPGQRIFYRVRFQDLNDLKSESEPVTGSFNTFQWDTTRDITLAWSADTVGQGWGINPDFGGLRLYETMLRAEPDLFVHCGDTIYADGPLAATVKLDDGTIWRNVVTPAKSKAAETIEDFRGNFQYNLMDEHMRRFNGATAQAVLWDDHEVRDNWFLTRDLSSDARYSVKSAALLAARARQAFFEYNPLPIVGDDPERIFRMVSSGPLMDVFALDLRSYRGPNSPNRQETLNEDSRILGAAQVQWLTMQLAASKAVWRVIACDMPVGLVIRDGESAFDAIANGDDGPARGREVEIAEILKFLKDRRVRNVVWITGDVHHCAAHRYDPQRARFTNFDPFWEFVAGPLHAGTFRPNAIDATFGPEVKFVGVPADLPPNRPPSAGLQFFGTLKVSAKTRVMTASLHDLSGRAIYRVELEAAS